MLAHLREEIRRRAMAAPGAMALVSVGSGSSVDEQMTGLISAHRFTLGKRPRLLQLDNTCPLKSQLIQLRPDGVAADKAYDSDAFIAHLHRIDAQAVIPSRANRREQRPLGKPLYCSRHLVERFFARIKQFRRVATR
ncbi:transposase [Pandoraea sputorum]|uniref:transposase n=1 Tax=Pandoraea sputorum TaxID=93222 RepID=UPI00123F8D22|nr:transposase [Pandoraea sputorum]